MQFENSIDALEWFISHKLGTTAQYTKRDRLNQTYDDAMVTAADVQLALERFSEQHQRVLLSLAIQGKEKTQKCFPRFKKLIGDVARTFKRMLEESNYLINDSSDDVRPQIAA